MSVPSPVAASPPTQPEGLSRWHRRLFGLCLAVFAFDLGLFLLVFPWSRMWAESWIPVHSPHLAQLWMSRYFRGFVSGVGLLNLYVALHEAVRQVRLLFRKRDGNIV